MAFVDIVILAILAIFLIKGIWRGLLREVCSLLGLVLGGLFAFTFNQPAAEWLQASYGLPARLSAWGSFLVIFLMVIFLFGVVGFVLNRFVKLIFLGGFNRRGYLWHCAGGCHRVHPAADPVLEPGSQMEPVVCRRVAAGPSLCHSGAGRF